MSLEIIASVGVFVGGVSFGFAGFAFGLFATAALALVAPPQVVVPAVLLVSETLALPLLWTHRQYVNREHLRSMPPFTPASLVLLVAGVALGALLLGYIPAAIGRLALAAIVLLFVGARVRSGSLQPSLVTPARWWHRPTGVSFVGGILNGWLGAGGIAIVVFLTARGVTRGLFIAATLAYFLISDLIRAATYVALGYWTASVLSLYVRTLPIAFFGWLIGIFLHRVLHSERAFRTAVLAILATYAIALVARALDSFSS